MQSVSEPEANVKTMQLFHKPPFRHWLHWCKDSYAICSNTHHTHFLPMKICSWEEKSCAWLSEGSQDLHLGDESTPVHTAYLCTIYTPQSFTTSPTIYPVTQRNTPTHLILWQHQCVTLKFCKVHVVNGFY
jgi:hypothetical protein